jgi:hypothetical protein
LRIVVYGILAVAVAWYALTMIVFGQLAKACSHDEGEILSGFDQLPAELRYPSFQVHDNLYTQPTALTFVENLVCVTPASPCDGPCPCRVMAMARNVTTHEPIVLPIVYAHTQVVRALFRRVYNGLGPWEHVCDAAANVSRYHIPWFAVGGAGFFLGLVGSRYMRSTEWLLIQAAGTLVFAWTSVSWSGTEVLQHECNQVGWAATCCPWETLTCQRPSDNPLEICVLELATSTLLDAFQDQFVKDYNAYRSRPSSAICTTLSVVYMVVLGLLIMVGVVLFMVWDAMHGCREQPKGRPGDDVENVELLRQPSLDELAVEGH